VLALVMPLLGTGFTPRPVRPDAARAAADRAEHARRLAQRRTDVVDAARGMGMTANQVLRRIELPIALPAVFAGLRTRPSR
jgi:osmoprotectant transport system permease protein